MNGDYLRIGEAETAQVLTGRHLGNNLPPDECIPYLGELRYDLTVMVGRDMEEIQSRVRRERQSQGVSEGGSAQFRKIRGMKNTLKKLICICTLCVYAG